MLTGVGKLRPSDTMVVDGIRTTKVARTLLDLAEVLTLDQLVKAINNLRARGGTPARFTWRQVVNDPDWVVKNLATFVRTA